MAIMLNQMTKPAIHLIIIIHKNATNAASNRPLENKLYGTV